jgi:hypothetical protein
MTAGQSLRVPQGSFASSVGGPADTSVKGTLSPFLEFWRSDPPVIQAQAGSHLSANIAVLT